MVGACYENECSEQFLGGWSTIPFGVTTTKYENQVFDWWVNSGTTMSNRSARALPHTRRIRKVGRKSDVLGISIFVEISLEQPACLATRS